MNDHPQTLISFDLSQVLTPEELEKFIESAKAAKAETLTEHFLNITINKEPKAA
jgi:hypothetical protein